MIVRRPINTSWALAGLALATTVAVAEQRLVIDMGAVKSPPSSTQPQIIHYQGTGSVRYSGQRSYQSAQARQSVQVAEERTEISPAKDRTTAGASERRTVDDAQSRTHSEASTRHGSVRLDTVR